MKKISERSILLVGTMHICVWVACMYGCLYLCFCIYTITIVPRIYRKILNVSNVKIVIHAKLVKEWFLNGL